MPPRSTTGKQKTSDLGVEVGGEVSALAPVTNDARDAILSARTLRVGFRIEGICAILFHRWSNEDVAAKQAAAKNSVTKKTDNLEACST